MSFGSKVRSIAVAGVVGLAATVPAKSAVSQSLGICAGDRGFGICLGIPLAPQPYYEPHYHRHYNPPPRVVIVPVPERRPHWGGHRHHYYEQPQCYNRTDRWGNKYLKCER